MELSEETQARLRAWLSPETWHTRHDADMRRFYDFVAALWRENRKDLDENELREELTRALGERAVQSVIEDRIRLASDIVDFLNWQGGL